MKMENVPNYFYYKKLKNLNTKYSIQDASQFCIFIMIVNKFSWIIYTNWLADRIKMVLIQSKAQ